ncbi:hypothetical protein SLEP1_g29420 [Rubroshorea leprosula]|uniref:Uncharacterized protein n=1 Tax=Rubroshorea leprosula TaxID=152421 RepID=A0AAV5K3C6_9ROSI|nr:hypothetical protein SLEP1_g29420 [Rubroshorea leprosula]
MSRSSLDSTSTSLTISSSSNSLNYSNNAAAATSSASDAVEPGVGGVPNRFLGITPVYLWQNQLQHTFSMEARRGLREG